GGAAGRRSAGPPAGPVLALPGGARRAGADAVVPAPRQQPQGRRLVDQVVGGLRDLRRVAGDLRDEPDAAEGGQLEAAARPRLRRPEDPGAELLRRKTCGEVVVHAGNAVHPGHANQREARCGVAGTVGMRGEVHMSSEGFARPGDSPGEDPRGGAAPEGGVYEWYT